MATVVQQRQLFGCAICNKRKPIEAYPIDEDHNVRLTVTCTECLEASGITQRRRGLIDQLNLALEDLGDSTIIEATTLKRKRSTRNLTSSRRRNKRTKIVRPPPPEIVTCTICFDDKKASEFPTKPPGPRSRARSNYKDVPIDCAVHLHYTSKTPVCKECIGQSLTAAVDIKDPEKLGCPSESCNAIWDQRFIREYLAPDAFAHYSEVLFQQYVAKRTMFYCLDPKCAQGGIVEIPAGYPNLECGACKKRACAICKVEWHDGMTCQQYREEHGEGKDEEELRVLRRMAKKGAKRCSNCQLAVEKDGGCDYMWCPHCRQQFFWATAEPVRAATKTTRQSSSTKKEDANANPPAPVYNPLARPCEADAAAARAAGQPVGGPVPPPMHHGIPGFPPPPIPHLHGFHHGLHHF